MQRGFTFIMLLFMISLMSIALMAAFPVMETQLKREMEEELIFRANQIVEGIRLYQMKHPGKFPSSLKELLKEKCIRKLWTDPMTPHGRWYLVVLSSRPDELLLVPEEKIASYPNPRIVGVASQSHEKAIRVLEDKERYDEWLFLYGKFDLSKIKIRRWSGE